MTNVLTLAALAAVAALSVTSPVFAQAFDLGARNDKVVTVGSAQGVLRNRQIFAHSKYSSGTSRYSFGSIHLRRQRAI